MLDLQTWAIAICFTMLASVLLRMVCPEGNFTRLLRIILGVFVLCALVAPPRGISGVEMEWGEYEETMVQAEEFAGQAAERSQEMMTASLESLIRQELIKNEISFKKVSVLMDTSEEGRIVIRQIQVTLSQGQDVERAESLLKESLGLETEVTADENR